MLEYTENMKHDSKLEVRLVLSCEDSPDVNDDVDGVGQQFQGELCLQQGMNLLHMVRDVLTDVLKSHTHTETHKKLQK